MFFFIHPRGIWVQRTYSQNSLPTALKKNSTSTQQIHSQILRNPTVISTELETAVTKFYLWRTQ